MPIEVCELNEKATVFVVGDSEKPFLFVYNA